MNAAMIIAGKELKDGIRNRWILALTLLLAALALSLAFLGSAPVGAVDAGRLSVTIVSLASLTIFLVPLIALMLSYDAIVGDQERGTLLLVLTYPVSRWQLLFGKFIGHLAIIAIAMTAGYGLAAVAIAATGEGVLLSEWLPFAGLLGTSILLGGAFLAIGYLISTLVAERATAAGVAVGIWLIFVLIYDMALLGILVADQGENLKAGFMNILLLANPTDAFRLFNLTGTDALSTLSGMAAAAGQSHLPPLVPLLVLLAWNLLPLSAAGLIFKRKEI